MQRFLDIVLSSIALLVLSPILLPTICILSLTGEKEVFFVQRRIGKGGRVFDLLKLATMLKNSPHIGTGEITVKNDPRVLPFGRFLRKTKLNELPQLWNIIIGDMSIVGPRPMVPGTFAEYPLEAQKHLNTIRPGLTGIGSIVFRDEERFLDNQDDPKDFYRRNIIPYKSDLETWFIDNNSLWLYFKIILVTAWVLIYPESQLVGTAFKNLPIVPDELKYL
jgi:lipopolysaccharide/colanic/teichoic acid biosynthesis glycosyltransferase